MHRNSAQFCRSFEEKNLATWVRFICGLLVFFCELCWPFPCFSLKNSYKRKQFKQQVFCHVFKDEVVGLWLLVRAEWRQCVPWRLRMNPDPDDEGMKIQNGIVHFWKHKLSFVLVSFSKLWVMAADQLNSSFQFSLNPDVVHVERELPQHWIPWSLMLLPGCLLGFTLRDRAHFA